MEKNQYSGPPVTLDVLQLESHPVQHVAEVTVTVPTGGWTINLDKAEIKGGVAEVYLTLEGPGADEMVTQAQETLQVRHASTVPPFTSARVWVHLARRDIQTLTTNYRLAAP